ncbi:MAG: single-stranded DNA-binding protein [Rhodospirillaceae bacterium]|nr:single-stranded DNA-binding protein [Rhodospirillaceae bacterium]MDE0362023.1 single-stranded DNA-binding protein [Rhodospirillaceae bacterium]
MFGLNLAQVIGRLGADVTINHLPSGGRVANMSIATDEGYINRDTGERVEKTEWHRVVTFQPGLVDMLEKHARKGRLVYIAGTLQTRRWRKDGEESDRFATEIRLAPGGRVQFLDKPNGANGSAGNGSNGQAAQAAPAEAAEAPATAQDLDDDIPF